jgi:hypothetical protein
MIDRIESTDHEAGEPVAETSAPVAQPAKIKKPRKPLRPLTLEERLLHGCFSIPEVAQLCECSVSSINKDLREGRLTAVKMGGRTRILGPELTRYRSTERNVKRAAKRGEQPA